MNPGRATTRQFATCLALSAVLILGIVQWSFLPVLIQGISLPSRVSIEVSPGHSSKFAAPFKCLSGTIDYLQSCLKPASLGVSPIFNGRLFSARRNEANSIAQAQEQYLRDLQNRIVRDVRTAWLNANSAFQRLAVTEQLLAESTQAFDLAQSRYGLGLSSIVELSQAQLNKPQAEIARVSAQYDYEGQIAYLNYQLGRMQ